MSTQAQKILDAVMKGLIGLITIGVVANLTAYSSMRVSVASTEIRVETMDQQIQEIRADLKHQGRQLQEILVAIARLSPAHNTGED